MTFLLFISFNYFQQYNQAVVVRRFQQRPHPSGRYVQADVSRVSRLRCGHFRSAASLPPIRSGVLRERVDAGLCFHVYSGQERRGEQRELGEAYQPRVLVADSAPAITRGFAAVFGEAEKRVHCFTHVKTGSRALFRSSPESRICQFSVKF